MLLSYQISGKLNHDILFIISETLFLLQYENISKAVTHLHGCRDDFTTECTSQILALKQSFRKLRQFEKEIRRNQLRAIYGVLLTETENNKTTQEFKSCLGSLDTMSQVFNNFQKLVRLSHTVNASTNLQDFLPLAEEIVSLYFMLTKSPHTFVQDTDDTIEEVCMWISELCEKLDYEATTGTSQLREAGAALLRAWNIISLLYQQIDLISTEVNSTAPLLQLCKDFLDEKVTKIFLVKNLPSNFIKGLAQITGYNRDIEEGVLNFEKEMRLAQKLISQGYSRINSLPIQLLSLNSNNYQPENISQFNHFQRIQLALDNVNLSDVFQSMKVSKMSTDLAPNVDFVVVELQHLHDNLKEYKSSTKIDSAFLL